MKQAPKARVSGTIFLPIVITTYIVLAFLHPSKTLTALDASFHVFLRILPIITAVIILLGVFNYFFDAKKFSQKLQMGSGVKGWFFALAGGVISHGPVYVWYPLLTDLRTHGMRDGLIVAFVYSRSIKVPMLPVMIDYFGWKFTVILSIYILIASVLQGVVMDFFKTNSQS
ncbi:permease [Sulfurimonas sp. HSL-1716]|uniref:permease n=1 Tax=Hydrocurvibacter sulfurireducens TaxID=3131937 RepID=UPI0031F76888